MIFRSHIVMNKKKKFPETNYVYLSLSGLECLKLWKHVFYISKEKCSNLNLVWTFPTQPHTKPCKVL